jgi:hypothetical protein
VGPGGGALGPALHLDQAHEIGSDRGEKSREPFGVSGKEFLKMPVMGLQRLTNAYILGIMINQVSPLNHHGEAGLGRR